jgi:CBS domain-containing protein
MTESQFWSTINEQSLEILFDLQNHLVTVKADDTIKKAMVIMAENEYLSLPVMYNSEIVGIIDALDICCLLADKNDLDVVYNTLIQEAINYSRKDPFVPLYQSGPFSALLNILSSGVHRCPIVDNKGAFIGVISQIDVIILLADTYGVQLEKNLSLLGSKTIEELGMLNNVNSVPETATVFDCIKAMAFYKVSGVPLVNSKNEVVGNFSISDIVRKIHKKEDLEMTLKDFIKTPLSWPVTTYPTTTLVKVIKQLNAELLHRIWIVDDNNQPRGVVSLTDVVRQLKLFYKDISIE